MKYYSEEQAKDLRTGFEDRVLGWPQVTKNKQFGCPCYEAKGKLFAFLVTDGVVLTQLLEGDREALRAKHRAAAFGSEGRKIQKWVQVPAGAGTTAPSSPTL